VCLATPGRATTVRGVCDTAGPATGHAAVVWVDSLSDRVERRLSEGPRRWFWQRRTPPRRIAEVVLRQQRFAPRLSAVQVGGGLIVRNADRVWHGVFSVSPGQSFELGKRAPGHADTLHFDRIGALTLRCDIHPDETAWVVVTPNSAVARTDRNGAWTLPALPAGRYRLHAWWPDGFTTSREVTVAPKGTTTVRFARSPASTLPL
jgi:hypothetical protein